MSLLVRKIDHIKWQQNDIFHDADVSADAITNCMKTKSNQLSVWEIPVENNLDDAALAIVTSGQHIETMYVALLERQALSEGGIELTQNEGATPIEALKKTHYDLDKLTYPKLGVIAQETVMSFKKKLVKRYTEGRLVEIVTDAITKGILEPSKLSTFIQDTLKKKSKKLQDGSN
jgi:hypothetical protein